jgi:hypothetical protein
MKRAALGRISAVAGALALASGCASRQTVVLTYAQGSYLSPSHFSTLPFANCFFENDQTRALQFESDWQGIVRYAVASPHPEMTETYVCETEQRKFPESEERQKTDEINVTYRPGPTQTFPPLVAEPIRGPGPVSPQLFCHCPALQAGRLLYPVSGATVSHDLRLIIVALGDYPGPSTPQLSIGSSARSVPMQEVPLPSPLPAPMEAFAPTNRANFHLVALRPARLAPSLEYRLYLGMPFPRGDASIFCQCVNWIGDFWTR